MSEPSTTEQIIGFLSEHECADPAAIGEEIGKTEKQVKDLLYYLRGQGKVERNHLGAWELTAEGAKAEAPAAARKATKGRQAALARGQVRKATRRAIAAPAQVLDACQAFWCTSGDWVVVSGDRVVARVPAEVAEAIRRG